MHANKSAVANITDIAVHSRAIWSLIQSYQQSICHLDVQHIKKQKTTATTKKLDENISAFHIFCDTFNVRFFGPIITKKTPHSSIQNDVIHSCFFPKSVSRGSDGAYSMSQLQ